MVWICLPSTAKDMAVEPLESDAVRFAFDAQSKETQCGCPALAAARSGVRPSMSTASTSAPLSTKGARQLAWPELAASQSAVRPAFVVAFRP